MIEGRLFLRVQRQIKDGSISEFVYCLVDVLGEQDFGFESGLLLAGFLGALIELRGLAYFPFQVLVLDQKPVVFCLKGVDLLLSLDEVRFEPTLLQLKHISDLLHLPVLDGLQLHLDLLPNLDGLPAADGVVVEDIHIGDSLLLEVALQLLAPVGEELVAAAKKRVGLLGSVELLPEEVVLHLALGVGVAHFALEFVVGPFELQDFSLVAIDEFIEIVLFESVGGLELSHFFSVLVAKLVDLLDQVVDLFILQSELRIQDSEFSVLVLNRSVQVLQFILGLLFDVPHRRGVILQVLVLVSFQTDDFLAQHLHVQLLVQSNLLVLLLPVLSLACHGVELPLKGSDPSVEVLNLAPVPLGNLIEVSVQLRNVLVILCLEPVHRVEQLNFVLPLDQEYLVLEPSDVSLQIVLNSLVFLDLLLVHVKEEADL